MGTPEPIFPTPTRHGNPPSAATEGHTEQATQVQGPGAPACSSTPLGVVTDTTLVSACGNFLVDMRGFFAELAQLSIPQLRQRYQDVTGDDRPHDVRYMIRRLAFLRQSAARAEKPAAGPRWTAKDIATGRAITLRCDRCRREVTVGAETVARLRRAAERGEPSTFLCATCRDEQHRRQRERDALERTRSQIAASSGSRPSAGLLTQRPYPPPSGGAGEPSSPAGGRAGDGSKMSPPRTCSYVDRAKSPNGRGLGMEMSPRRHFLGGGSHVEEGRDADRSR